MLKKFEDIKVPIEVGDTVLGGRFKNKKTIVKKIGKNKKGDITINDKPLLKYRIVKEMKYLKRFSKYLNKESYNSDIFLVIDNSKPPENKYSKNLIKYLSLKDIVFKVAKSPEDIEMYNKEYNIIGSLSTGSEYSMKEPSSNLEYSTNERALEILKSPIIAICYGFQSMAKFYGEEISGGDLNCDEFLLTRHDKDHFLFNGIDLNKQKLSFCFHDYPINVPNGFKSISFLNNIITGISNKSIERYGFLFHPEDILETNIILDNFIKHCHIKNESIK
jgi:anthranilate/para-aminobenzoate synthase component II